jgi:hypothetical protein
MQEAQRDFKPAYHYDESMDKKSSDRPLTPMCDLWSRSADDRAIIRDFLETASNADVFLCKLDLHYGEYEMLHDRDVEKLLMKHAGVDPAKLEEERRALVKQAQDDAKK